MTVLSVAYSIRLASVARAILPPCVTAQESTLLGEKRTSLIASRIDRRISRTLFERAFSSTFKFTTLRPRRRWDPRTRLGAKRSSGYFPRRTTARKEQFYSICAYSQHSPDGSRVDPSEDQVKIAGGWKRARAPSWSTQRFVFSKGVRALNWQSLSCWGCKCAGFECRLSAIAIEGWGGRRSKSWCRRTLTSDSR